MLKKRTMGLLLAFSISLIGCSKEEAVSQTDQEPKQVPVQVEEVVNGSMNRQAGIAAKLTPNETVQVAPKVSGKISKIHVSLGQQVNKGDVLFSLDQSDLANAVEQAKAGYNVAQASLKQAQTNSSQGIDQSQSGLVQSENAIKQAQNNVIQAEQALKDAQTHEQRIKQLFEAGAVPKIEMENAQTAAQNAAMALESAQNGLENAQIAFENAKKSTEYAQKQTALEVAKANVNQARVNLENAQEQLANANVIAPISGIVSVVNGTTGQMASPQMPVVTLVHIDPIVVKANISEQQLNEVQVGIPVQVEVSSIGQKLEAKVTAVSPVMDVQLKAYPIEINIPNPKQELKADMVADVTFGATDKEESKTLIISRRALIDEQGKRYVFKLEDQIAKKVEVKTGKETSDQVEVQSGLSAGDVIVIKGQTMLKDGDQVKVQE